MIAILPKDIINGVWHSEMHLLTHCPIEVGSKSAFI